MNLSLYAQLAKLQGDQPWGAFLDAGTGRASMRWLLGLATERWTAVTGSARMAEAVHSEVGERRRALDRIVTGNWRDPDLLDGECYDTVLADYLLGAVEGFAPYWQDQLFARLRPLVGKRLYVIGVEPYVHDLPETSEGRLVGEIGRLRDACLLLAGQRPYREYPLEWVLRHLSRTGLHVVDTRRFPIRYGERFVNSQLDLCSRCLDRVRDRSVAVAMQAAVAETRARALAQTAASGGLRHGHDYIVVAVPRR